MLVPDLFSDKADRAMFLAFVYNHSFELRSAYHLTLKLGISITWEQFIGAMLWHDFCN